MTFSATVTRLIQQERIIRIEVPLRARDVPDRLIYGVEPGFTRWLTEDLPSIPQVWDAARSPSEQVFDLFYRFTSGKPVIFHDDYWPLRPAGSAVWELKTPDVRMFGWFPVFDCFLACFGMDAYKVKDHNLYPGFRAEVVRLRDELGLPYLSGQKPHEVISV